MVYNVYSAISDPRTRMEIIFNNELFIFMKKLVIFIIATLILPTLQYGNSQDNYKWSVETVDYKGKVGRYTSIAID